MRVRELVKGDKLMMGGGVGNGGAANAEAGRELPIHIRIDRKGPGNDGWALRRYLARHNTCGAGINMPATSAPAFINSRWNLHRVVTDNAGSVNP